MKTLRGKLTRFLQFLIDAIDALVADDQKKRKSQRDQFKDEQKRFLTFLGSGTKDSSPPT